MSSNECNEDTEKGHNWCLITSKLQTFTSDEISIIKNGVTEIRITKKYVSGIAQTTSTENIPNLISQYPTPKKLEEDPNSVITAIEVSVNNSEILEITGIYYTSIENILSKKDIKAYTEEINPYFKDSIKEYHRDDIINEDGFQIGYYDINSTKYLLAPPNHGGFGLTGYEYIGNGFTSVKQIIFHFTSFIDQTLTYSVCVNNGNVIKNYTGNLFGENHHTFYCPSNSFIQSINIAYTPDFIDLKKKKESTRVGDPPAFLKTVMNIISVFYSVSVSQSGVGMKGISSSTYITYPQDVYKWIATVDDIKCCHLVEDEQYDDKTIEKDICLYGKDLSTRNEFPLVIPNDKCDEILQTNLSTKNIDTELYKNYCKLPYSDCDSTIRGYCDSKYTNSEGKLNLENMYKDPVCGCYSNYDFVNPQNSYHSSLDLIMGDKSEGRIKTPSRFECTAPVCVDSSYKFKTMKERLAKQECSPLESCFGKGYYIPYYKDGKEIDCVKYENDNSCIPPYKPKYEFLANPFNRECEDQLKNVEIKKFLTKGCELYSRDKYKECGACGKNGKMYCKKEVRTDGYPVSNCKNPLVKVDCEYKNYTILIGFFIGFIFMIILLIIILKKIKNNL